MAAPEEASIQGKLKRCIKFTGGEGEIFEEWKQDIECYLDEWRVLHHLTTALVVTDPPADGDASALSKYNNRCVYTFLISCVDGKAKTKASAVATKKNPKLAWEALEKEFNKRAELDVESLIT
jgi:hypothetical protein